MDGSLNSAKACAVERLVAFVLDDHTETTVLLLNTAALFILLSYGERSSIREVPFTFGIDYSVANELRHSHAEFMANQEEAVATLASYPAALGETAIRNSVGYLRRRPRPSDAQ